MIMATCIYCPQTADSLEHPLPAAFGEFQNAPYLADRICKKCNNERLGLLDEQLTRCGPEAFMRKFYGVQGRATHNPVNPFYRGSAKAQRLELKVHDPELGFEILLECNNGEFRALRQIVFIEQSGKTHHLLIREGSDPEQLRAEYKTLGSSPPYREVRVFCDPKERVWVEPLLKDAWPQVWFGTDMTTAGNTLSGGEVKITLTNRYFRAVAKIGFHYFLSQFLNFTGHEPIFSDIRQFILDESAGVDVANKFVGERKIALIGNMLGGSRPDGWFGHSLCADITSGECRAHVQLFISDDFKPRIYTVRLGTDTALQSLPGCGHCYCYYPTGRQGKLSGEAVSLTSARADFPPLPLEPVIGPE
jgi:hypothetical protein